MWFGQGAQEGVQKWIRADMQRKFFQHGRKCQPMINQTRINVLDMFSKGTRCTYLAVLKLFLLNASTNALVKRNALKDAFPRAVFDVSRPKVEYQIKT